MLLEVCAYNIQSALVAQKAGAGRVELCDSAAEGGTTPSHGVIALTRERLTIDLYPIIRPRAGNFLYDEEEFGIMKQDILLCKELGCDGISTGVQLASGAIDTERLKRLVEWAYPMGVTCHRVFDATPDPFKALEDIIGCGCERILTSGQKSAAPDAADMLARLVQAADGRIIIMPGAGVRSGNIATLVRETGATEYHTSARIVVPNAVSYQNPAVTDIGNQYIADENELREMLGVLETFAS